MAYFSFFPPPYYLLIIVSLRVMSGCFCTELDQSITHGPPAPTSGKLGVTDKLLSSFDWFSRRRVHVESNWPLLPFSPSTSLSLLIPPPLLPPRFCG